MWSCGADERPSKEREGAKAYKSQDDISVTEKC